MRQLITTFIVFSSLLALAQSPIRFYTKFGGGGIDVGYGVKQTLDRNFIVVGSTSSYGAGNSDVYLVKVDTSGWTTWQKTFGGFGNDVGRSIIQLPDSGYVIAGFTNSYGAGGYDALIIRTDKSGNLLWQKTFGGLDWDFGYDLVNSSDGNIVLCGTTTSFGHGNKDGFVIKLDPSGSLLWQKFFGGTNDDELKSIIKTSDNSLATVGYNQSLGDINGNCYLIKLDLNGDTMFTRNFGGPYKDFANDLVQKSNGDYVIGGAKTYSAGANPEALMYSTDVNGQYLWENHYTSTIQNEGFVSVANSNQLPTLTGFLRDMSFPAYKIQGESFIANPGGWYYKVNAFGGSQDEHCYSMESTLDGGFVTVGTTESFGSVNSDVFLIKQDSTISNYTSVVSLKENYRKQNGTVFFSNNAIHIKTENATETKVFLYDLTGKQIKEWLVNDRDAELEISGLAPSIYFVTVEVKNQSPFTTRIAKTE